MVSASMIRRNIVDALANETAIERNGQNLRSVSRQLGYAGIKVTEAEITEALDAVSVVCPSVFGEQPAVSTHYTSWGTEWRLRSNRYREDVRPCMDAIYAVTDTLDRTPEDITLNDGSTVSIETVRPRAFAIGMGHLRVRWAQGNFTPPRPSTVRRWIGA